MRSNFDPRRIKIDDKNEVKNMNLFKRRVLGLTSYFRSAQEKLMPAYTKEKKFTVYNLERDFETKSADYVQLIFDTFSDATNAFQFQTNKINLAIIF